MEAGTEQGSGGAPEVHREELQPAGSCKQAMLHHCLLPGSRCSGQPGHIAVNRLKKIFFLLFPLVLQQWLTALLGYWAFQGIF